MKFDLEQLSERLDGAIHALESVIPFLDQACNPTDYVQTTVVKLLFPVVRDLVIAVKTIHEDIEIETAGYSAEMRRLIEVVRDLILADILPIHWAGLLLATIHKPMLDVGLIKSAQDFTELFRRQLQQLGEEGKRLEGGGR